ncbi:GyrI-like domain-containing protein [Clostridium sp. C2-6-12]|uniref:GyrI-like domain-containing protein n=1 Tax=Clostridium sp. C2-6-12 TaxID=2698832 RepID=UPI00136DDF2E|nr:GyrI-like domain-containing protein [Clostridium sp. C2-6-12]
MKFEWKKQAKELYMPKEKVQLLTVPEFNFFMIKGKGNPNHEQFSEAIGVLYSLSYAVKMMPKSGITPEGYFEYTVFPLEGIWDMSEKGRQEATIDKNEFIYTIMIRQPDFVTKEIAEKAIEIVKKKKPHPLLEEVIFDKIEDGLCIQILHVGSYDDEPGSFAIMKKYCEENNLKRVFKNHREIYITDARKTEKNKLKTILRYRVKPKE